MPVNSQVSKPNDSQRLKAKQQHQLYQQALLTHHKKPVGFEKDVTVHSEAEGYNAACGDEISIGIEIEFNKVKAISFHGDSCAICRASASLLCLNLPKLSKIEAASLSQQIVLSIEENITVIGELADKFSPLLAVQQFPVRKQCAILPWATFSRALTSLE